MNNDEQRWSKTAAGYSSNVARTSAPAGARLVDQVNQKRKIDEQSSVLDVGAGTGAVTLYAASKHPSANIIALDVSSSMLENISQAELPHIKTVIADARNLTQDFGEERFSHVFCAFMLQVITTPLDAIKEMRAILKPGGVVGLAVWGQKNDPYDIWERACQTIDPSYRLPDPFEDPHAWRTPEDVTNALEKAGFKDVEVEEMSMAFSFESAEAFTRFWFEGQNPSALNCLRSWHGDMAAVRKAHEKITREDYGDGRNIKTWAALGSGRRPA